MKKKMIAKLIAVMAIAVLGMSLGCIGTTTIKDIEANPDYHGKEVVVEGVLERNTLDGLREMSGSRGFSIREDKEWKNTLFMKSIYVRYNGEIPTRKGASGFYVPGTVTKVKVTGIVENERAAGTTWMPYIRATSWEYI